MSAKREALWYQSRLKRKHQLECSTSRQWCMLCAQWPLSEASTEKRILYSNSILHTCLKPRTFTSSSCYPVSRLLHGNLAGDFEGGIRLAVYYTEEITYTVRHSYNFLLFPLHSVKPAILNVILKHGTFSMSIKHPGKRGPW